MTIHLDEAERARLEGMGVQMGGAQHDYTTPEGRAYLDAVHEVHVDWTDADLAQITCLRLLSDPGYPYWDVSYVHGVLKDGRPCRVSVPFFQLSKRKWKSEIVEHARRDGVYAKGLGIFDNVSTLQ